MDPIDALDVRAYTIPAATPEADGTIAWAETTIITVEATAGSETGFGYTYGDLSVGLLVAKDLSKFIVGRTPSSPRALWIAMIQAVRNIGRPGVAAMAISAVDMAIWDLKARLLGLPITGLIGAVRDSIAVYGSGGFTSYSIAMLEQQLGDWAQDGIKAVKMKVGTHPEQDVDRVSAVREVIGPEVDLYVDANGAYLRKQALEKAFEFADLGVCWFEEPVSSDDLAGLRHMRDHTPPRMEVAAGEYGYDIVYFRRMLEEGAVDVMQADATRCGGVTGFLSAAEISDAWNMPLSAHTAPSLHGHLCCCVPRARNVEYFFDHIRIEQELMEGALVAKEGVLRPDVSAPGFGLAFKHADAEDNLAFKETCTS